VDRHRFDADPDSTFHFDADPEPNPDWHQNNADPNPDLTQVYTSWKIGKKFYFYSQ
jgi:hypothetical protein